MEATLLTIAGSVILVLLAVVGFFLKGFNQNVKSLENSSHKLETATSVLKEIITNMQGNCKERHNIIDKRLNDHSSRLDHHSKDIAVLKSKSN